MKTGTATIAAVGLVLGLAGGVGAGEIVLKNGSRLTGELANEWLMVSTGQDVIEVAPREISVMTREEIQLKDGRVIRGTLVGGHLKARTPLGELAINLDELSSYRAEAGAAPQAASATALPPPSATPAAPRTPAEALAPPPPSPPGTPSAPAPAVATPAPSGSAPVAGPPAAPAGANGPTQVAEGSTRIGQGVTETAKGIGRTVVQGADMAHDGFKAFGLKVWNVMKGIGQVFQNAFGS